MWLFPVTQTQTKMPRPTASQGCVEQKNQTENIEGNRLAAYSCQAPIRSAVFRRQGARRLLDGATQPLRNVLHQ